MNTKDIKAAKFLDHLVNDGVYMGWAEQSHNEWKATKENQGWKYGEKRDDQAKTNPLIRPFAELPDAIKGQNYVTPYATVNFFRVEHSGIALERLDDMLESVEKADSINDLTEKERTIALRERMCEYIHSHFMASQFPQGGSVKTRKDMVTYDSLSEDTKSWDRNSAIKIVGNIRKELKGYK